MQQPITSLASSKDQVKSLNDCRALKDKSNIVNLKTVKRQSPTHLKHIQTPNPKLISVIGKPEVGRLPAKKDSRKSLSKWSNVLNGEVKRKTDNYNNLKDESKNISSTLISKPCFTDKKTHNSKLTDKSGVKFIPSNKPDKEKRTLLRIDNDQLFNSTNNDHPYKQFTTKWKKSPRRSLETFISEDVVGQVYNCTLSRNDKPVRSKSTLGQGYDKMLSGGDNRENKNQSTTTASLCADHPILEHTKLPNKRLQDNSKNGKNQNSSGSAPRLPSKSNGTRNKHEGYQQSNGNIDHRVRTKMSKSPNLSVEPSVIIRKPSGNKMKTYSKEATKKSVKVVERNRKRGDNQRMPWHSNSAKYEENSSNRTIDKGYKNTKPKTEMHLLKHREIESHSERLENATCATLQSDNNGNSCLIRNDITQDNTSKEADDVPTLLDSNGNVQISDFVPDTVIPVLSKTQNYDSTNLLKDGLSGKPCLEWKINDESDSQLQTTKTKKETLKYEAVNSSLESLNNVNTGQKFMDTWTSGLSKGNLETPGWGALNNAVKNLDSEEVNFHSKFSLSKEKSTLKTFATSANLGKSSAVDLEAEEDHFLQILASGIPRSATLPDRIYKSPSTSRMFSDKVRERSPSLISWRNFDFEDNDEDDDVLLASTGLYPKDAQVDDIQEESDCRDEKSKNQKLNMDMGWEGNVHEKHDKEGEDINAKHDTKTEKDIKLAKSSNNSNVSYSDGPKHKAIDIKPCRLPMFNARQNKSKALLHDKQVSTKTSSKPTQNSNYEVEEILLKAVQRRGISGVGKSTSNAGVQLTQNKKSQQRLQYIKSQSYSELLSRKVTAIETDSNIQEASLRNTKDICNLSHNPNLPGSLDRLYTPRAYDPVFNTDPIGEGNNCDKDIIIADKSAACRPCFKQRQWRDKTGQFGNNDNVNVGGIGPCNYVQSTRHTTASLISEGSSSQKVFSLTDRWRTQPLGPSLPEECCTDYCTENRPCSFVFVKQEKGKHQRKSDFLSSTECLQLSNVDLKSDRNGEVLNSKDVFRERTCYARDKSCVKGSVATVNTFDVVIGKSFIHHPPFIRDSLHVGTAPDVNKAEADSEEVGNWHAPGNPEVITASEDVCNEESIASTDGKVIDYCIVTSSVDIGVRHRNHDNDIGIIESSASDQSTISSSFVPGQSEEASHLNWDLEIHNNEECSPITNCELLSINNERNSQATHNNYSDLRHKFDSEVPSVTKLDSKSTHHIIDTCKFIPYRNFEEGSNYLGFNDHTSPNKWQEREASLLDCKINLHGPALTKERDITSACKRYNKTAHSLQISPSSMQGKNNRNEGFKSRSLSPTNEISSQGDITNVCRDDYGDYFVKVRDENPTVNHLKTVTSNQVVLSQRGDDVIGDKLVASGSTDGMNVVCRNLAGADDHHGEAIVKATSVLSDSRTFGSTKLLDNSNFLSENINAHNFNSSVGHGPSLDGASHEGVNATEKHDTSSISSMVQKALHLSSSGEDVVGATGLPTDRESNSLDPNGNETITSQPKSKLDNRAHLCMNQDDSESLKVLISLHSDEPGSPKDLSLDSCTTNMASRLRSEMDTSLSESNTDSHSPSDDMELSSGKLKKNQEKSALSDSSVIHKSKKLNTINIKSSQFAYNPLSKTSEINSLPKKGHVSDTSASSGPKKCEPQSKIPANKPIKQYGNNLKKCMASSPEVQTTTMLIVPDRKEKKELKSASTRTTSVMQKILSPKVSRRTGGKLTPGEGCKRCDSRRSSVSSRSSSVDNVTDRLKNKKVQSSIKCSASARGTLKSEDEKEKGRKSSVSSRSSVCSRSSSVDNASDRLKNKRVESSAGGPVGAKRTSTTDNKKDIGRRSPVSSRSNSVDNASDRISNKNVKAVAKATKGIPKLASSKASLTLKQISVKPNVKSSTSQHSLNSKKAVSSSSENSRESSVALASDKETNQIDRNNPSPIKPIGSAKSSATSLKSKMSNVRQKAKSSQPISKSSPLKLPTSRNKSSIPAKTCETPKTPRSNKSQGLGHKLAIKSSSREPSPGNVSAPTTNLSKTTKEAHIKQSITSDSINLNVKSALSNVGYNSGNQNVSEPSESFKKSNNDNKPSELDEKPPKLTTQCFDGGQVETARRDNITSDHGFTSGKAADTNDAKEEPKPTDMENGPTLTCDDPTSPSSKHSSPPPRSSSSPSSVTSLSKIATLKGKANDSDVSKSLAKQTRDVQKHSVSKTKIVTSTVTRGKNIPEEKSLDVLTRIGPLSNQNESLAKQQNEKQNRQGVKLSTNATKKAPLTNSRTQFKNDSKGVTKTKTSNLPGLKTEYKDKSKASTAAVAAKADGNKASPQRQGKTRQLSLQSKNLPLKKNSGNVNIKASDLKFGTTSNLKDDNKNSPSTSRKTGIKVPSKLTTGVAKQTVNSSLMDLSSPEVEKSDARASYMSSESFVGGRDTDRLAAIKTANQSDNNKTNVNTLPMQGRQDQIVASGFQIIDGDKLSAAGLGSPGSKDFDACVPRVSQSTCKDSYSYKTYTTSVSKNDSVLSSPTNKHDGESVLISDNTHYNPDRCSNEHLKTDISATSAETQENPGSNNHVKDLSILTDSEKVEKVKAMASCSHKSDNPPLLVFAEQLPASEHPTITAINDKEADFAHVVNILPDHNRGRNGSCSSDDYFSMPEGDDDFDDSDDETKVVSDDVLSVKKRSNSIAQSDSSDFSEVFATPMKELSLQSLKDLGTRNEAVDGYDFEVDKGGNVSTKCPEKQFREDMSSNMQKEYDLCHENDVSNDEQTEGSVFDLTNDMCYKCGQHSQIIPANAQTFPCFCDSPANMFTKHDFDNKMKSELIPHEEEIFCNDMSNGISYLDPKSKRFKIDKNQKDVEDCEEKWALQTNLGEHRDDTRDMHGMLINEKTYQGACDPDGQKSREVSQDHEEEHISEVMDFKSEPSSENILTADHNKCDLLSSVFSHTSPHPIQLYQDNLLTSRGHKNIDILQEEKCVEGVKGFGVCATAPYDVLGGDIGSSLQSKGGEGEGRKKTLEQHPTTCNWERACKTESNYETDNLTTATCKTCAQSVENYAQDDDVEAERSLLNNKTSGLLFPCSGSVDRLTTEQIGINKDDGNWESDGNETEDDISEEFYSVNICSECSAILDDLQMDREGITTTSTSYQKRDLSNENNKNKSETAQERDGKPHRCVKYEIVTTTIRRRRRREEKVVNFVPDNLIPGVSESVHGNPVINSNGKIFNSTSVKFEVCKETISSDISGQIYSSVRNCKNTEVIEKACCGNFDISDNATASAFTPLEEEQKEVALPVTREGEEEDIAGKVRCRGSLQHSAQQTCDTLRDDYRDFHITKFSSASQTKETGRSRLKSVKNSGITSSEKQIKSQQADTLVTSTSLKLSHDDHDTSGDGVIYEFSQDDFGTKHNFIPSDDAGSVIRIGESKTTVLRTKSNTKQTFNIRVRSQGHQDTSTKPNSLPYQAEIEPTTSKFKDFSVEIKKEVNFSQDSDKTNKHIILDDGFQNKVSANENVNQREVNFNSDIHATHTCNKGNNLHKENTSTNNETGSEEEGEILSFKQSILPVEKTSGKSKYAVLITNDGFSDENKQENSNEIKKSAESNIICLHELTQVSDTYNHNKFTCENATEHNLDSENVLSVTLPIPVKIDSEVVESSFCIAEVNIDACKSDVKGPDENTQEEENSVTYTISMELSDKESTVTNQRTEMPTDNAQTVTFCIEPPKVSCSDSISEQFKNHEESNTESKKNKMILSASSKTTSPKGSKKSADRNNIRRHTAAVHLADRDGPIIRLPAKPRARSKSPIKVKNTVEPSNESQEKANVLKTRKVSDICQSFLQKNPHRKEEDQVRPLSPVCSPSPCRKLKWVRDQGTWKRVTYEEYDRIVASQIVEQKVSGETEKGDNLVDPKSTEIDNSDESNTGAMDMRPKFGAVLKVWQEADYEETQERRNSLDSVLRETLTIPRRSSEGTPKIPPKTLPKPKYHRTRTNSAAETNIEVNSYILSIEQTDTSRDELNKSTGHLEQIEFPAEIFMEIEDKTVEFSCNNVISVQSNDKELRKKEGQITRSDDGSVVYLQEHNQTGSSQCLETKDANEKHSVDNNLLPLKDLPQSINKIKDGVPQTESSVVNSLTEFCSPNTVSENASLFSHEKCPPQSKTMMTNPIFDDIPSIDGVEIENTETKEINDSVSAHTGHTHVDKRLDDVTCMEKLSQDIELHEPNQNDQISAFVAATHSPKKIRAVRIKQEIFPKEPSFDEEEEEKKESKSNDNTTENKGTFDKYNETVQGTENVTDSQLQYHHSGTESFNNSSDKGLTHYPSDSCVNVQSIEREEKDQISIKVKDKKIEMCFDTNDILGSRNFSVPPASVPLRCMQLSRSSMSVPGTPERRQRKLLSEIVELEENGNDPASISSSPSSNTQEHHKKLTRQRGTDCLLPSKEDNSREFYNRSQSLPNGSLTYGNSRIVYKNGHFVVENDIVDICEENKKEQDCYNNENNANENIESLNNNRRENINFHNRSIEMGKLKRISYSEPQLCESVDDSVQSSIGEFYDREGMDEEDDDDTDIDQDDEAFVNNDGDTTVIDTSDLNASNLEVTRRTKTIEKDGRQSRPLSVDENQLQAMKYEDKDTKDPTLSHIRKSARDAKKRRSKSFREMSEQTDGLSKLKRNSSFREAQEKGSLKINDMNSSVIGRTSRSDSVDSISRPKSPGFLQRLLFKRKSSFTEKNLKSGDQSMKDSFMKKMTLKGLFTGKKDKNDLSPTKSDISEPLTPPSISIQEDDNTSILSTDNTAASPGSPFSNLKFRRRHTSGDLFSQNSPASSEKLSGPPGPPPQLPRRTSDSLLSRPHPLHSKCVHVEDQQGTNHYSLVVGLDHPRRPISPKPSNVCLVRRNSSLSLPGSPLKESPFELTIDKSPNANRQDFDSISSSSSFTGSNVDCNVSILSSNSANVDPEGRVRHGIRKQSSSELDPLSSMQVEMVSSNSNDSGIQRDVSVNSSNESIKSPNSEELLTSKVVRRRKSPSPRPERPKSEISVRWADAVETTEITPVKRREGSQRNKPRPKSDLEDNLELFDELYSELLEDLDSMSAGSSLASDMKPFGSENSILPYSSLQSLESLRLRQEHDNKPSKRRMSTPQPIKTRLDRVPHRKRVKRSSALVSMTVSSSSTSSSASNLTRSHSMPESLDKLHRYHVNLNGCQHLEECKHSLVDDEDSSEDGSDISLDRGSYHDRNMNYTSSNSQLAPLSEMPEGESLTYAEALWDHITMDPEELGFKAGDVIEVLDGTDRDWWWGAIDDKEGWFPATFVRLRANQEEVEEETISQLEVTHNNIPKIRRVSVINKEQARQNVINEILCAEREYVNHLQGVVEGYIKHARKRKEMFSDDMINVIFGNIEEIYTFSMDFLESLEEAFNAKNPSQSELGHCFLSHSKQFEIYSDYCNNHPSATEELKQLYKKQKYKHFFEACRLLQEMIEIPLEGFLLTPVQKICKYPLQLNELLKYTPPAHKDHNNIKMALDAMKKIAALINERKRKMESIEKLAVWQQTVEDWQGPDLLEHSSELITSAELYKVNTAGWSQERFFFLFDYQLIYCKKDLLRKNGYCYKGRIDMNQCEIIDVEDGKDVQYGVSVKNAWKLHETDRKKWYLLYTKSAAEKQKWMQAFQAERDCVQKDQENNIVPSHWKKTVLNQLRSNKEKNSRARNIASVEYEKEFIRGLPSHATLPRSYSKKQREKKKGGWSLFGGKKSQK